MTVIDEQIDGYEAEIADVAGSLNVVNARLVEAVARLLVDEAWVGTGVHSRTRNGDRCGRRTTT